MMKSVNLIHNTGAGRKTGRCERAFTLVEVVIAISILAVIMSTAYSAIQQILSTKRVLDDKRDVSVVANAILRRLTREFQLATADLPLIFPNNSEEESIDGSLYLVGKGSGTASGGFQDSVTFIAQEGGQYMPDGGTHNGAVQITYRGAEDPERRSGNGDLLLIREEVPYITGSGGNTAEWRKAKDKAFGNIMIFPVAENLVSFRMRYYNIEREQWQSDWGLQERGSMPGLIKFSLSLRSPLGRVETYTTSVPVGSTGRETD